MTDPTPLNAAELAEVRARSEARTGQCLCGLPHCRSCAADSRFYFHARTDIPRLLATIEQAEKQRDGLLAALNNVVRYIELVTPTLPSSLHRAEAMGVCAEAAEAYWAAAGVAEASPKSSNCV